jgi:hypothetical protein
MRLAPIISDFGSTRRNAERIEHPWGLDHHEFRLLFEVSENS